MRGVVTTVLNSAVGVVAFGVLSMQGLALWQMKELMERQEANDRFVTLSTHRPKLRVRRIWFDPLSEARL